MFFLRGLAVSLALFVLSYCMLSLLVVCGWRFLLRVRDISPRMQAGTLIVVRLFPFALSLLGTLTLVVPSFVMLEPRAAEEEVGLVPVVLALACLLVLVANLARAIHAQAKTNQVFGAWLHDAHVLEVGVPARAFKSRSQVPPLTVAGVCRPRLLFSEAALSLLTEQELQAAVRHELAHIRFGDNLKKLAVKLAWFPGMAGIESAWHNAAELAADDAAVANANQALDLASALVKVLRHCKSQPLPAISMGFVSDGSVKSRIERLLNWEETAPTGSRLYWLFSLLPIAAVAAIAFHYAGLLNQVHLLTEWLVR